MVRCHISTLPTPLILTVFLSQESGKKQKKTMPFAGMVFGEKDVLKGY